MFIGCLEDVYVMFIGCLEDVYRAFFLRECCVSGSAVCQGLLFVRDYYLLSGTIILQGLLFVRDYCFLSGTVTAGLCIAV